MGVTAMAVSLIAVPLVSLVTKKFDAAHVEKVFGGELPCSHRNPKSVHS
jgi:hypothetical protein